MPSIHSAESNRVTFMNRAAGLGTMMMPSSFGSMGFRAARRLLVEDDGAGARGGRAGRIRGGDSLRRREARPCSLAASGAANRCARLDDSPVRGTDTRAGSPRSEGGSSEADHPPSVHVHPPSASQSMASPGGASPACPSREGGFPGEAAAEGIPPAIQSAGGPMRAARGPPIGGLGDERRLARGGFARELAGRVFS